MTIEAFLYLEKPEYAESWMTGGLVPSPKLASSYLSKERKGTMTPDETHIIEGDDPRILSQYGILGIPDGVLPRGSIEAYNNYFNDQPVPNVTYSHRIEDGYILSFSHIFNPEIGACLGKSVCVKIMDMQKLKRSFDEQMGIESTMGSCNYVHNHIRDHFTKLVADQWQDEFRIFWPTWKIKKYLFPEAERIMLAKPKPLIVPKELVKFVGTIPRLQRLKLCPCLSGKRYKHCHGLAS